MCTDDLEPFEMAGFAGLLRRTMLNVGMGSKAGSVVYETTCRG